MSSHDTVVDWSLLLGLLRARSGRALSVFARSVGMDELTINKLARGEVKQPLFAQGLRLLDACEGFLSAEDWARVRALPAPEINRRASAPRMRSPVRSIASRAG